MCTGNFWQCFHAPKEVLVGILDPGYRLTGAGQFLRSVRKDEFGPTEMQFDKLIGKQK